jgi:hypothetical protein
VVSNLNVTLDKIITYTDPNLPKGKVTFIGTSPSKPTAEQMLKKALEYAKQGMYENSRLYYDSFVVGNYHAYEMMAAHLEMLIKEAKQNG